MCYFGVYTGILRHHWRNWYFNEDIELLTTKSVLIKDWWARWLEGCSGTRGPDRGRGVACEHTPQLLLSLSGLPRYTTPSPPTRYLMLPTPTLLHYVQYTAYTGQHDCFYRQRSQQQTRSRISRRPLPARLTHYLHNLNISNTKHLYQFQNQQKQRKSCSTHKYNNKYN